MTGSSAGAEMSRPLVLFIFCMSIFVVLFFSSGAQKSIPFNLFLGQTSLTEDSEVSAAEPIDRLLGGLLTEEFEEASCVSRYQVARYWKVLKHKPSTYLVNRLRRYEALHKKCAPNTQLYNKTIDQLKKDVTSISDAMECNYIVWIADSGLGNKLVTLISTFLYALLSDKVLLLRFPYDMQDIFCEPFPESTWILPSDFPVNNYVEFDATTPQSLGNLFRDNLLELNNSMDVTNASVPAYIYLNLMNQYNEFDKNFFCEDTEVLLQRSPLLFLRSNLYFAPAFFQQSMYDHELNLLFPEKQTVFHHLARYLIHPTNSVWGGITRYYDAYLAKAHERIGLQIRIFPGETVPFETRFNHFINCTLKEGLLPATKINQYVSPSRNGSVNLKAVIVTSLKLGYSEKLKAMYFKHPTSTGDMIAVFQPSHEEEEQFGRQDHSVKALTEMYLLSFCDKLVTSMQSTFGYVAQSLGGIKPWIVFKPFEKGEPFCRQDLSIDPCFLIPPYYDCKTRKNMNSVDIATTTSVQQHVGHCVDTGYGLKLLD